MSLVIKIQLLGEHRHNARDLFLCVKSRVEGKGLEFCRYLPVHASEDVHELQLVRVQLQHRTERLDEPGPVLRISPGIVTYEAKNNRSAVGV